MLTEADRRRIYIFIVSRELWIAKLLILLSVSLSTVLQVQRNIYPVQREIAHFPPSLGHHHSKFGRNAPPVQQIALNFAVLNSYWEAVLFKVSYLSCTAAKLIDFFRNPASDPGETPHTALSNPASIWTTVWGPLKAYTLLYTKFIQFISGNRWSDEGHLMSPVQNVSERINFASLILASLPLLSISFLFGRCWGRVNDGNSHSEAQINSPRQK